MNIIPYEVLEKICLDLTHRDVVNLLLTCKDISILYGLKQILRDKTRCLTMTVCREDIPKLKIIFDSISPYISYWVIGDCRSDDDKVTKNFIIEYFSKSEIKGEFHQLGQYNGAKTLTKLMNLAKNKASYIIYFGVTMHKMTLSGNEFLNRLTEDYYMFPYELPGMKERFPDTEYPEYRYYYKTTLLKGSLDWKFDGGVFAHWICRDNKTRGIVDGVEMISIISDDKK